MVKRIRGKSDQRFVQNEPWWREIQSDPLYQEFITEFYGKSLGEDL